MGNCIKKQPAIQSEDQETKLLAGGNRRKGDDYSGDGFSGKPASTEVKIKISKKQLEELLGRADVQGLTVEQVLAQLMNVSDRFDTHQRSWRPALHSIPE
ncbi:hypothetical protein L6452_28732 [Arctium lappa]|uniref:Uncharacterized protein n=1 Tax=Arctium lappa TaxID=4217 RepID=A0ACB9A0L9_ARCLA|nr:hypothetical protein L6452_28732 [Arctium lappa]